MDNINEFKLAIGKRLSSFLKAKNLNANSFARSLGYPQTTRIYKTLDGRSMPYADFFYDVINVYPEMNIKWLITGEGNMVNDIGDANIISMDAKLTETEKEKLELTISSQAREIELLKEMNEMLKKQIK